MLYKKRYIKRIWQSTITILRYCNENVDIKFSAHDAFLT